MTANESTFNIPFTLKEDTPKYQYEWAIDNDPTAITVSGNFTQKMLDRLYKLVRWRSSVKQVTISNSKIKPEVAKHLAKMVRSSWSSPLKIHFENCRMDQIAFKKITKLPSNGISELCFINCGIDDQMIGLLPEFTGMTSLNIKNNKITDKGATLLNKWLTNNISVTTLNATGNKISKKLTESFDVHLEDNRAIAGYLKQFSEETEKCDLSKIVNKDDKNIVRRLCKLLAHKNITKIVLPTSTTFSNQEQLQLADAFTYHSKLLAIEDTSGKSLLSPTGRAQKQLKQNALNQEIINPSTFLRKWLPNIAVYIKLLSIFVGFVLMLTPFAQVNSPMHDLITNLATTFPAFIDPHLMLFIMGVNIFITTLQWLNYDADFQDKLVLLKDKSQWEESDRSAFDLGAKCTKSFAPYFSLQSYTPAGYLGYYAAKTNQLDILPEKVVEKPKLN